MTPMRKEERRKMALIVNPISGTRDKEQLLKYVMGRMEEKGIEAQVEYTRYGGHASLLTGMLLEKGFKEIVAIGGDGTVNEVASALTGTQGALGIIPFGSGNGLARHLKIPMHPIKAFDVILENNIVDIDYCTANGRKYFCAFGVGYDAEVAETFAREGKRGLATYVVSAIKEYGRFQPDKYKINIDGEELTDEFYIISASNGSQYGNNAFIAPQAVVNDGLLDLVMIRPGTHLTRAMLGIKLFTDTISDGGTVTYVQVPQVEIRNLTSETFHAHIDGEPVEMSGSIRIKCHKRELKVFVPAAVVNGVKSVQ